MDKETAHRIERKLDFIAGLLISLTGAALLIGIIVGGQRSGGIWEDFSPYVAVIAFFWYTINAKKEFVGDDDETDDED